jgi:hypothetical protein
VALNTTIDPDLSDRRVVIFGGSSDMGEGHLSRVTAVQPFGENYESDPIQRIRR